MQRGRFSSLPFSYPRNLARHAPSRRYPRKKRQHAQRPSSGTAPTRKRRFYNAGVLCLVKTLRPPPLSRHRETDVIRSKPFLSKRQLALITAGVLSICAIAQEAEPTEAPVDETTTAAANALPTFIELYQFSPAINAALLSLSGIALALFLFFLLTINHRSMVPATLIENITKLVVRNKHDDAGNLCRANKRVFIATILQRLNENADKDPVLLINILETEGRRRADVVWNRISYLADIANIAPMVGLLGTVIGMIKAFFALDLEATDASNHSLAQGVGEAMATTLFGLAVAIAASVFYAIVKGRTTKVLADAEQAVHTVADLISKQEAAPKGVVRRVLKKKSKTLPPPLEDENDPPLPGGAGAPGVDV